MASLASGHRGDGGDRINAQRAQNNHLHINDVWLLCPDPESQRGRGGPRWGGAGSQGRKTHKTPQHSPFFFCYMRQLRARREGLAALAAAKSEYTALTRTERGRCLPAISAFAVPDNYFVSPTAAAGRRLARTAVAGPSAAAPAPSGPVRFTTNAARSTAPAQLDAACALAASAAATAAAGGVHGQSRSLAYEAAAAAVAAHHAAAAVAAHRSTAGATASGSGSGGSGVDEQQQQPSALADSLWAHLEAVVAQQRSSSSGGGASGADHGPDVAAACLAANAAAAAAAGSSGGGHPDAAAAAAAAAAATAATASAPDGASAAASAAAAAVGYVLQLLPPGVLPPAGATVLSLPCDPGALGAVLGGASAGGATDPVAAPLITVTVHDGVHRPVVYPWGAAPVLTQQQQQQQPRQNQEWCLAYPPAAPPPAVTVDLCGIKTEDEAEGSPAGGPEWAPFLEGEVWQQQQGEVQQEVASTGEGVPDAVRRSVAPAGSAPHPLCEEGRQAAEGAYGNVEEAAPRVGHPAAGEQQPSTARAAASDRGGRRAAPRPIAAPTVGPLLKDDDDEVGTTGPVRSPAAALSDAAAPQQHQQHALPPAASTRQAQRQQQWQPASTQQQVQRPQRQQQLQLPAASLSLSSLPPRQQQQQQPPAAAAAAKLIKQELDASASVPLPGAARGHGSTGARARGTAGARGAARSEATAPAEPQQQSAAASAAAPAGGDGGGSERRGGGGGSGGGHGGGGELSVARTLSQIATDTTLSGAERMEMIKTYMAAVQAMAAVQP
ncbi:hypothetical protein FOA52_015912 [Chlamydomonas sp. UWO 241]|nr:hypothetical protein FOA52_015912 [Chlamydomonas sp. UWO 241]